MTTSEKLRILICCVSIVISLVSLSLSAYTARLAREADDQQAVGLARDALRQVGEQEDKDREAMQKAHEDFWKRVRP